jgi:hypothetical protein
VSTLSVGDRSVHRQREKISTKQFYKMDICCGLHVYIYKKLMLFQDLFPALSDDTEIRNIYATIAS